MAAGAAVADIGATAAMLVRRRPAAEGVTEMVYFRLEESRNAKGESNRKVTFALWIPLLGWLVL